MFLNTMTRACVYLLFVSVFGVICGEETFTIYQTPERIIANGYPAERHEVITEDGYILEMHRIPRGIGEDDGNQRPVVFLMHGLLAASNSFINIGTENGVAYNMADAGFDVWMGNARGTRNSRRHVTLDPDHEQEKFQFFNFSFEEIGRFDLPAMIDYILVKTGRNQLHYVGHSQGGTVFLVMGSMRPEYNKKLTSVHLFAGVGYQNFFPTPTIANMATHTDNIYSLALTLGIVELYPSNGTKLPTIGKSNQIDVCTGDDNYMQICNLSGARSVVRSQNDSTIGMGGAALKQIALYGQNIRDKAFRRWNYGSTENMEIYGQLDPPAFNLSLITANVTMHYTVADNLLDERDVLSMAADMPNAIVRRVARDTFLHSDFVVAEDSRVLVTEFVIKAMHEAENELMRDSSSNIALSLALKVGLIAYSIRIIFL